jgi:hypothetical protein
VVIANLPELLDRAVSANHGDLSRGFEDALGLRFHGSKRYPSVRSEQSGRPQRRKGPPATCCMTGEETHIVGPESGGVGENLCHGSDAQPADQHQPDEAADQEPGDRVDRTHPALRSASVRNCSSASIRSMRFSSSSRLVVSGVN